MARRVTRLVLDASVAVKWYSMEEFRNEALLLREDHVEGLVRLTAPDLLVYEVNNALRHNPVLSEADVKEAVRSLLKLHIDLHQPTFQLVDEATENAFAYSITAYDSIYIGLAELLNCVLVTADDELFEKAKESGRISLVSSYPSLRAEQS